MLKRLSTIFCALPLMALATLPAYAQGVADAPKPVPEVTFNLKSLDGKTYNLEGMRGKVVLVSFGATWCVPCAWELAAIEELKDEFKDKPVEFLWVSVETKQEASNALLKHYSKTQQLTIPVLRDFDRTTFAQFSDRVRIPLVVFFDQKGKFIAPAHRGMASEPIQYKNLMRTRIEAILNSPSRESGTSSAGAK
ncbi:MAG TPA: TlpA disulfide reductase family protein [Pyrinomonadaceae bacterium]|jgi:thiol-disulfide isomerase/thioredoxin|nr:TlpA disulfide reductase family protein [Pyrinomonadaceae bacterium]